MLPMLNLPVQAAEMPKKKAITLGCSAQILKCPKGAPLVARLYHIYIGTQNIYTVHPTITWLCEHVLICILFTSASPPHSLGVQHSLTAVANPPYSHRGCPP